MKVWQYTSLKVNSQWNESKAICQSENDQMIENPADYVTTYSAIHNVDLITQYISLLGRYLVDIVSHLPKKAGSRIFY